jgi:ABC-2 type transport system ATP-binding protein
LSPALEIQSLSKTYPGGHEALCSIDLQVEQGDFFALLGPNGAGKSTTIGIVTSLVRRSGGSVRVFGHDIDREPMEARRRIGLVPQEFNFNVFEPVVEILINQAGYYGIPRRIASERAEEVLDQLGLGEKMLGQARELSGGMKRRLMIARALVHRPGLLILDEPTAGVDIELRRQMWSFLTGINRNGTTIILTTHYLEEAERLCRNVAIINEGRIVENTSIKALLDRLDREAFLLDTDRPLDRLPLLPDGYRGRLLDDGGLEVEVPRQPGLNPLFAALDKEGIGVVSMRNRHNRLEELFLSLVEGGR